MPSLPTTSASCSPAPLFRTHGLPPPPPGHLPRPTLQAFTRSSQLEPDNGEAWNNLAAIHMHLQHWRQAFNALTGEGGGVVVAVVVVVGLQPAGEWLCGRGVLRSYHPNACSAG